MNHQEGSVRIYQFSEFKDRRAVHRLEVGVAFDMFERSIGFLETKHMTGVDEGDENYPTIHRLSFISTDESRSTGFSRSFTRLSGKELGDKPTAFMLVRTEFTPHNHIRLDVEKQHEDYLLSFKNFQNGILTDAHQATTGSRASEIVHMGAKTSAYVEALSELYFLCVDPDKPDSNEEMWNKWMRKFR